MAETSRFPNLRFCITSPSLLDTQESLNWRDERELAYFAEVLVQSSAQLAGSRLSPRESAGSSLGELGQSTEKQFVLT
jgi:hypothetical protein